MRKMLTGDSSIGEFMLMYVAKQIWQVERCASEELAAQLAVEKSKETLLTRFYVVQVTREFFSTAEVTELKVMV